jgi:hypothetical protein
MYIDRHETALVGYDSVTGYGPDGWIQLFGV